MATNLSMFFDSLLRAILTDLKGEITISETDNGQILLGEGSGFNTQAIILGMGDGTMLLEIKIQLSPGNTQYCSRLDGAIGLVVWHENGTITGDTFEVNNGVLYATCQVYAGTSQIRVLKR